jgi:tRNA(Ile2) C34 agmatinyltransferase TiaS
MRRISARLVPRLLSDNQKALHISVYRELKQARDDPSFISNIITGDEIWVCGYDPETIIAVEVAKFTAAENRA